MATSFPGSKPALSIPAITASSRSEEHTSELQSPCNLVCRLLLEKKKLQRIFRMSSLMLLLVWLILFMVLITPLSILGPISGQTVQLLVLALLCLVNHRQDCHPTT